MEIFTKSGKLATFVAIFLNLHGYFICNKIIQYISLQLINYNVNNLLYKLSAILPKAILGIIKR